MSGSESRVVVTGMGAVTPLGASLAASSKALRTGDRGLSWLPDGFYPDPRGRYSCRAGGLCVSRSGTDAEPNALDPVTTLAMQAASEAIDQSRLQQTTRSNCPPDRMGVVIGTSKGGVRSLTAAGRQHHRGDGIAGEVWMQCFPDAAAREIARTYETRGPLLCPVAACATGLICLIRAAELIQHGECDVVIAGSSDASVEPDVLAFFSKVGVLANLQASGSDDGSPQSIVRPYDSTRSGFLVGEGAGVLVLESEQHARKRNAKMLATWEGASTAADPSGIMQLDPNADCLTRMIRDALRRAKMEPSDIDAISLHGTATKANDVCEATAVQNIFGVNGPPVFSLKGATGHLLGAAGSVETALSLNSMLSGEVPTTANLNDVDPHCKMNHPRADRTVTPGIIQSSARTLLKVSLGFGGHLAATILRVCRS